MFTQFLPKTTTDWTYIVLIVVLVITLILFYKGIMKCKSIIESYNNDIREYKKNLTLSRDFITYVKEYKSFVIDEYFEHSGTTMDDFISLINEVDTDNA